MGDVTEDWLPSQHAPNIAMSQAWMWARTVGLQLHRIRTEADGHRELLDAAQMIVAMRHVLRGAQMTKKHVTAPEAKALVSEALHAFNAAVPGGKPARDAIEHFEDYGLGMGDYQQRGIRRHRRKPDDALAQQYREAFRWEDSDGQYRPIYAVGPHEIDLIAAEDATFRLQCDVYEAVRANEGSPVPKGWAYQVQRGV